MLFRSARNDSPWGAILAGADWLHLSGVTPALGPECATSAVRAAQAAADAGVAVSFDGNYRSQLWSLWPSDPPEILGQIMKQAEIAFIDDRDIALVLRCEFKEQDADRRRHQAAEAAFAAFPKLQRIASLVRTSLSATSFSLSAVMFTRSAKHFARQFELAAVVDRIGTGDAFAAGVLHSVISGAGDAAAVDRKSTRLNSSH